MKVKKPVTIVIADDDAEDRMMIVDALKELRLSNPMVEVENGEELMDCLHRRGKFAAPVASPLPGLILLDLNMPKLDGREALKEIKQDPELRKIPVVVLTTSKSEEDVLRSYDVGANSFIVKPVTYGGFVDAMRGLGRYWFEIVEIPYVE